MTNADTTEQSRIAAERHCEMIRDYWFDRGYQVNIKPRELDFEQRVKSRPYALDSDMVNGLPRNWRRAND